MSFINSGMMASQGVQVNSRKMVPYVAAVGTFTGSTVAFVPDMPACLKGDLLILAVTLPYSVAQITVDPLWVQANSAGTGGLVNGQDNNHMAIYTMYATSDNMAFTGTVAPGLATRIFAQITVIRGANYNSESLQSWKSKPGDGGPYVRTPQVAGTVSLQENDPVRTPANSVPGLYYYAISNANDSTSPIISSWTNADLVNITEHIDAGNTISLGAHMAVMTGDFMTMATNTAFTSWTMAANVGSTFLGLTIRPPD